MSRELTAHVGYDQSTSENLYAQNRRIRRMENEIMHVRYGIRHGEQNRRHAQVPENFAHNFRFDYFVNAWRIEACEKRPFEEFFMVFLERFPLKLNQSFFYFKNFPSLPE